MTNTSLNLSGRIDPNTVEIFHIFDALATDMKFPYVVVGATARDLVLHYGYGARMERATNDIDFAIQIQDWSWFKDIRDALLAKGFRATKTQHRLIGPGNTKVDIVPFGDIETDEANIEWPPTGDTVMNVLGFQEACDSAIRVCLQDSPKVEITVAVPHGMSLLKLIAWTDRDEDIRKKDAKDFLYLLKTYERIPHVQDELYGNSEIMENYEWNLTLGGAHLLGVHAAQIASEPTKALIKKIFLEEVDKLNIDRLVEESLETMESHEYGDNYELVSAYVDGFGGKVK